MTVWVLHAGGTGKSQGFPGDEGDETSSHWGTEMLRRVF